MTMLLTFIFFLIWYLLKRNKAMKLYKLIEVMYQQKEVQHSFMLIVGEHFHYYNLTKVA